MIASVILLNKLAVKEISHWVEDITKVV